VDWNATHTNEILVQMCDPRTLEVIGVLEGVELEGSTLSWGYDTDTRFSGTIRTLGSNWIEHSALRVIHRVPEWNYSKVIATGLVMERPWSRTQGGNVVDFQLSSTIAALEKDYIPWHYTLASGATSHSAFTEMISGAEGRQSRIESDAVSYVYNESKVYEMGDSRLADIIDICKTSGNRYDVDGYGVITMSREVPPDQRGIDWTLDASDARTNVLDGISGGTSKYNSPTAVIATYKGTLKGDDGKPVKDDENKSQSIELWSKADIAGPENSGVRGYTIAVVESVSDLEPQTQQALDQIAQNKANELVQAYREWELSCLYMPMETGDMVNLILPDGVDGGPHKCLVKNIELSLNTMVLRMTLKEV
jgi:hypothetical protein